MLPLAKYTPTDRVERRLLNLATLFLFIYSITLSIAPVIRSRSFEVKLEYTHWLGLAVWIVIFNLSHRACSRRLPERDPFLIPIAGLLSGWGLLTIYRLYPDFGLRQTIWLALGMVIFLLGLGLDPEFRFLRRYKYLWLTGGLALTGLTFLLGTNPLGYGPRMWLGCCGFYLQPAEPLKLLLIIYLSAYLADQFFIPDEPQGFRTASLLPLLAPTLVMTGLTLLILVIQRDLGTASIFLFLYAVMVYIASGRRRVLLITGLVLVAASLVGFWLFDVVKIRVDAWLNPWLDPSGRSFQLVQSLLAIANGGFIGRGPGLGSPGVVPVAHSDFIFTAIFEEAGLIGAIGLITLIAILSTRGLRAALLAPDRFRRYLAAGLTAYLAGQSILIIAGNIRMLPLTGVTLPFVSYGGSSLIVSMISLLLLVLISNAKTERRVTVQNPRPILQLSAFLLVSLGVAALISSWWVLVRGPALLTRTDNPRRTISDRFVRRGSILDRKNQPINQTIGSAGEYIRQNVYPDLSPIMGYTNPLYGQSGLEAALDETLRGLQGNPLLLIWWNHLLYGQPPPGLDIRTSLDLDLQKYADRLLKNHRGALVLLNPSNGEILAMASHPTFNANRLEELGESLLQNPSSPLVNRATQGLYPVGSTMGALLYGRTLLDDNLPELPSQTSTRVNGANLECATNPTERTWTEMLSSGCPEAATMLAEELGTAQTRDFFAALGLYQTPQTYLDAGSTPPPTTEDASVVALGLQNQVSPLQVALAVSILSTNGERPAPHLVTAVKNPETGWSLIPPIDQGLKILPEEVVRKVADELSVPGKPFWQSLAKGRSENQSVTWYLAGTPPDWSGTPLTLVIVLEEDDPSFAEEIGQKMIQYATGR